MKSFNRIQFKGVLGRDARVNNIGEKSVANFSVATERRYKDSNGEWTGETTWLDCVAWQGSGVCTLSALTKGAKVAGSGYLRLRKYTDRNGVEKTAFEVVVEDLDLIDDLKDGDMPEEIANNGRQTQRQGNPQGKLSYPF